LDLSNSFEPLDSSFASSTGLSELSSPVHTSSPIKTHKADKKQNTRTNSSKKPKPPHKPSLRTLILNARSLKNKPDQLQATIASTDPDIVVVTETWFNSSHLNIEFFPPNFTVHRKDRVTETTGGGVCIAVNNRILSSIEPELDTDCEILWTKIKICGSKAFHIGGFYRPPTQNQNDEAFKPLIELEKSLSRIQNSNANIWLCGDFNLSDIDWNENKVKENAKFGKMCANLIETTQEAGLEQVNHHPTRGQNILDLFFTNNTTLIQRVKVIPGICDHDIVLVDSLIKPMEIPKKTRKAYLYSKANFESLRNDLENFQKEFLENYSDKPVNDMWNFFHKNMEELQDKHIPSKMVTANNKVPWVDVSTRRGIRRKHRAYNRAKHTHDPKDWHKYRDLKHLVQKRIRQAYWKYINDMISLEDDPTHKGFWSYIKRFKRDSVGISVLRSQGKSGTSPEDKAEMLNAQFSSVFVEEDTKHIPPMDGDPFPDMDPIKVGVDGVAKLLSKLKPRKAAGPDNLPARVLKETAVQLAPILQKIYQCSIDQGEIPEAWRQANISPVYKKDDRCVPANYRPVSLTCILCKVLEHIVLL
jgi:hypothetical protein